MKVKTDDDQIILMDLPILRWFLGVFFSVPGLYLLIFSLLSVPSGGGFENFFRAIYGSVLGGFLVLTGYYIGLSATYQKVIIERGLKEIIVKRAGLINSETIVYAADEIETFDSESETDSEDITTHKICMRLKNRHRILLGPAFGDKRECEILIETVQKYLGQPDFSGKRQLSVIDDFSRRKILGKKPRRKKKSAFIKS